MISVRKAKISDVKEIRKIDKFKEILDKCSPLDKLDTKYKPKRKLGHYESWVYSKNKWLYIAEEENKVIGYILFNIVKREDYWEIKTVGHVDLVYVDEKSRKKGVSKLLMKKAKEVLKEKGMKYLTLTFQTDNERAGKVWKKHGYKEFRTDMYKKI